MSSKYSSLQKVFCATKRTGQFNGFRNASFLRSGLPMKRRTGNHFFAYSIKDTVVDWLNPKPITYQDREQKMITF